MNQRQHQLNSIECNVSYLKHDNLLEFDMICSGTAASIERLYVTRHGHKIFPSIFTPQHMTDE
ncbi:hypothetical protein BLOT_006802 [Blomia tropicalis]|nr:hypothetical protein BLOT_006802 [Blomia tropicalis]